MSLQYLIDGYNLIHQMSLPDNSTLEQQRNHLVKFIEINQLKGSARNNVTVVFDGQSGMGSCVSSCEGMEIVFSMNGSADDLIKRMAERAAQPKSIIVVTDDKEIIRFVRNAGARVMSVQEFFLRGKKRRAAQTAHGMAFGRGLPSSEERKITQELARIWVKEKKK